jgi:hypothetical protein
MNCVDRKKLVFEIESFSPLTEINFEFEHYAVTYLI